MSKAFKNNSVSANSAFKKFNKPKDAGEYILNKKSSTTYCEPSICRKVVTNSKGKILGGQGDYLLFKKASYLKYLSKIDTIYSAKQTLNNALITKIDLENVQVVAEPNSVNYLIDPSGNLFGNDICGEYNWQNYVTSL